MDNPDSDLIFTLLTVTSALLLLLIAVRRLIPWTKRFLPLGGSDENQAIALTLLAIAVGVLVATLAPNDTRSPTPTFAPDVTRDEPMQAGSISGID